MVLKFRLSDKAKQWMENSIPDDAPIREGDIWSIAQASFLRNDTQAYLEANHSFDEILGCLPGVTRAHAGIGPMVALTLLRMVEFGLMDVSVYVTYEVDRHYE